MKMKNWTMNCVKNDNQHAKADLAAATGARDFARASVIVAENAALISAGDDLALKNAFLFAAAWSGQHDAVKTALDAGADANVDVCLSARKTFTPVSRRFEAETFTTPLRAAINGGHYDCVKVLAAHDGIRDLHLAAALSRANAANKPSGDPAHAIDAYLRIQLEIAKDKAAPVSAVR